MKIVSFAADYVRLRASIAVGLHRIANPVDLHWRWNHWEHIRGLRARR